MSTKNQQKSKRFRNLTISLLLILIGLFTIGILTRSPSPISELSATTSQTEDDTARILSEIQESIETMQKEIEEIRRAQINHTEMLKFIQKEIETGHESNILSGPKLYSSYVDEITSVIYPDIPAEYVKAIIWHESRYQPDKTNNKTGVKGLMQISPKWHTKRAESLGVTNLFDPYGNILVGCDILHELTQQHDFNYALNFFAGGYPYADRYKSSVSPFVKELNNIIHQMENGEIILGGE